jgi:hypothetical protein
MPRAAQSKKYIINVYVLQKWYTQDKKNKKEKRKKKVGQTIPEDPMASPNYDKVWMTFFFFFYFIYSETSRYIFSRLAESPNKE